MRSVPLNEQLFLGAVSLERTEQGMKPWRIPYAEAELFPPNALNGKAQIPAGVRAVFQSSTTTVTVRIAPSEHPTELDCLVNGKRAAVASIAPGETEAQFEGLPSGMKTIELYLSQRVPVTVSEIRIDSDAEFAPAADSRPKWIAYGSSITQCVEAESPSQTWPAIAARKLGMNLTCLGYAANSHMEPMVARMIRDLPADFISLCFGINIMGGSSYSARTFRAGIIGFVQIVRESHPDIPIYVMSPIYCASRETTDNKVDLNLVKMREEIRLAVQALQSCGAHNVRYIDGLDLFDESLSFRMPDGLHPDAEGYRIIADKFQRAVTSE